MINEYLSNVKDALEVIEKAETNAINRAAEVIADSIEKGSILHVFGCGHSHMMSEEVFYRAGGLVPIHPIFVENLMLHKGGTRSTLFERKNGYAEAFMPEQDIRQGDVVIVVSTSGRNPVPIDVARISKEKGAFVIGLTSRQASVGQPSRHQKGQYLYEMVDLVLDNHVKQGDAVMHDEEHNISFGSISGILGLTMMNTIVVEAINKLIQRGIDPPIFNSGNIDGSDESNKALIKRYKDRIPLLDSLNDK
ncbi:SIS domain-containing protein [Bacillus sp. NTK071]|uniref:SIS domain-containing protein n=1 Tax=Bacillus sp. NTK071 TaxID=2802175 RepID=UPI001A9024F3|nr:SIS domain-containing protein [Bacillus sp. NTK071]MBN8208831.1 SIS domain-containing protein [Bacillus sp. NTK071]